MSYSKQKIKMYKFWIFVAIVVVPLITSLPLNENEEDTMFYIQQVPQHEIEVRLPNPSYRIYTGQSKFAVSLLKSISKSSSEKNHFISPHSTYRALLLAYFGAEGKTKESLESGLFLDWAKGSKSVVAKEFDAEWKARAQRNFGQHIEFSTVEELYVTKNAELNPSLTKFIAEAMKKVDFSNAEKRREEINSLVEEITENHIKNLLPEGSVTAATNLLLANAAFFRGSWATKFNNQLTEKKTFNGISPAEVDMMSVTGHFRYGVSEKLGAAYLELPFGFWIESDAEITMLVFLPKENTSIAVDDMLEKFTEETIQTATNAMTQEVDVQFPKISLDGSYVLGKTLEEIGIKNLFGSESDFSDFSNTTRLYFDDMIHKAKIEIDEEGSIAAAATATMSRSMGFINFAEKTKFHCDHPFVFTIYDRLTNDVLFAGVYRGPN